MQKISKAEARELGLKRFFTGIPCKHGHISERYVINNACKECELIKGRARYNADPEQARSRTNRYREANPEKVSAYAKEYRERSREKRAASWASYYQRNRDNLAEKSKAYRDKNKDAVKARVRAWSIKNQHQRAALQQKRKARQLRALPNWHGEFDDLVWVEAADLVRLRRVSTGLEWASDHMIPLSSRLACGLHVWNNCQVIPWELNQSKNNRLALTEPLEWLKYI